MQKPCERQHLLFGFAKDTAGARGKQQYPAGWSYQLNTKPNQIQAHN